MHYHSRTPPSSSPPSSPYPTSSSPPSSPVLDPLALDSDYELEHAFGHASSSIDSLARLGGGALMDPLAGSYRSMRGGAKRASGLACSPGQTPMKKKARFRSQSPLAHRSFVPYPVEDEDEDEEDIRGAVPPLDLEKQRQKQLWEEAIERVFETGERKIDLIDQNIVDVPPEVVRDLGKIVVLPEKNEPSAVDDIRAGVAASTIGPAMRRFERTHTAPAATMAGWARHGPNGKTVSSNSILGVSKEAMDIFLGKNNIVKLPMELWNLHNLTVLSLRNNSITYIPPEIANLKDLRALNLAHNKLRFIPSEMLQMKKLIQLNLFPNPFISLPLPNSEGKYVSKTELKGPKIPPFTELALRILLSRPKGTPETVLEQYYELPLATSQDYRPVSAFRDIFSVCVPGSVLPDENRTVRKGRRWRELEEDAANAVTGIGICPNPVHDEQSTFIRHAEQRYTWESSTVAITSLGGNAAVLWRGCMWGCLDFLGMAREDEDERQREAAEGGEADDSMDLDLQEDEEVVQTVRFETGTTLDFDD